MDTLGGERSWISAAVNLSMITMGPPHGGQEELGACPGPRMLFRFALVRSGVLQSTAAEVELGGGSQGSRSGGCARNLWGADAAGSGVGTHRAIASSASAHCCERSRANER